MKQYHTDFSRSVRTNVYSPWVLLVCLQMWIVKHYHPDFYRPVRTDVYFAWGLSAYLLEFNMNLLVLSGLCNNATHKPTPKQK